MYGDAQDIIRRAQLQLQDAAGVRWSAPELVRYLNQMQTVLATAKPQEVATTAVFTPVLGPRQELPVNGFLLLNVLRNLVGTRRAVTKVERSLLEASSPNWTALSPAIEARHWMYSALEPTVFDVYPPLAPTARLEIVYARYPVEVPEPTGNDWTGVTGTTDLEARWDSVLLDGVLYLAWSKDAEDSANAARAQSYLSTFMTAIGAQAQPSNT